MARAIDKRIMLDLIIEAKKTDPEAGPFSEWLAEYLVDHLPTLTPPNEPLTLDELREMDGEPVWVTPLGFWALVIAKPGERVKLICNDGEIVYADKEIELVGPVYRRPPEVEED